MDWRFIQESKEKRHILLWLIVLLSPELASVGHLHLWRPLGKLVPTSATLPTSPHPQALVPEHLSSSNFLSTFFTAHSYTQNHGIPLKALDGWHLLSPTKAPILLALSCACFPHSQSQNHQQQTFGLSTILSRPPSCHSTPDHRLPGQPRLHIPHHRTSKCSSDSKEVLWSNNFRALFTDHFLGPKCVI